MIRLQAHPTSLRRWWRVSLVLTAALLTLADGAWGKGRREGEEVVVAGMVTDAEGQPVAGAVVEVRASRSAFWLRDFRVARRGSRRARSTTDARGQFEISWSWHPYYNRFDLVAGVASGPPGPDSEIEVLATVDLSRRMKSGHPVVATVEIPDRSPVDSANRFLAGISSADQQRVYQEMGKPDKVRDTALPTYRETSWWYFERGKVYRFRDGEIQGVDDFEPILEIPD